MTNYKEGDKVQITQLGMFHSLSGVVLSNNKDSALKPLKIELNDGLGTWGFNHVDVKPLQKDKPTISPETAHGIAIEKKAVRAYVKFKVPEVKTKKRKYIKKSK